MRYVATTSLIPLACLGVPAARRSVRDRTASRRSAARGRRRTSPPRPVGRRRVYRPGTKFLAEKEAGTDRQARRINLAHGTSQVDTQVKWLQSQVLP